MSASGSRSSTSSGPVTLYIRASPLLRSVPTAERPTRSSRTLGGSVPARPLTPASRCATSTSASAPEPSSR
eukprot:8886963-Alexandrium_andersonii.AAC.1